MVAITKQKLSEATNGRAIKVGATATPGTLIHTAVNTASIVDEVWLYAQNTSANDVKLTLEFGGVTAPDDLVEFTVPAEDGLYLVAPGLLLDGGVLVRAFAGTIDVLTILGYVNRIDQS